MIARLGIPALILVLAAAAQGAISHRLAIGWASPDFILIAAVFLSVRRTPDAAAVIGFVAGLLHSALYNDYMLAFTVSRLFACLAALRINQAYVGRGVLNMAAVIAAATVLAGLMFLFLGALRDIGGWVLDTIGAAIYNCLVALVVEALLLRFGRQAGGD